MKSQSISRPAMSGDSLQAFASVPTRESRVETEAGLRVAPFQGAHLEQVLQLYAQVFGPAAASAYAARRAWQREQHPLYESCPEWVLTDNGTVRGFLSTVAAPYQIAGRRIIAHTPCDYMVAPEYRFHGIRLMQTFFRTCPNTISCDDMPPTIKVTRWLGAKYVGSFYRYVKVLDARAIGSSRGWNQAVWPLLYLGNAPLRWQERQRRTAGGPAVQVVRTFDERFQSFFDRQAGSMRASLAKDVAFLNWRYGAGSPHAGREIGVVTEAGELAGYVIFCGSTRGHTGYILDLRVQEREAAEVSRALLEFAAERLRQQGAWSVRFYQLGGRAPAMEELLTATGFMRRGWHQLLVRLSEARLEAWATRGENWDLAYGDCEASFSAR